MAELYATKYFSNANLQGYWRLNGDSNDSKSTNHGTDNAITYGDSYGRYSQGALFNGSSSYIDIGDKLGISSGAITLFGWIRGSSLAVGKTMLSRRVNSGGDQINYLAAFDGSSRINFAFCNAPASYHSWYSSADVLTALKDDKPHFWSVSFTFGTGSSLIVAIDGSSISGSWLSGTGNANPTNVAGQKLAIGATYYNTLVENFNGGIDDTGILFTQLTLAEMREIYYDIGKIVSINQATHRSNYY